MSWGYRVIPINDEISASDIKMLEEDMLLVPSHIPKGRFPSRNELREIIHELDFSLDEEEWRVASDYDHTYIWFRDESIDEDQPAEFSFERGYLVVTEMSQEIANRFGSLVLVGDTGFPPTLFLPEVVFPAPEPNPVKDGFYAVMVTRLPIMIERLKNAALEDILLILYQIWRESDGLAFSHDSDFSKGAEKGLASYVKLLHHEDVRVRILAFRLVAAFNYKVRETAESLQMAIQNESDPNATDQMINVMKNI
jgi:hypothetical protein